MMGFLREYRRAAAVNFLIILLASAVAYLAWKLSGGYERFHEAAGGHEQWPVDEVALALIVATTTAVVFFVRSFRCLYSETVKHRQLEAALRKSEGGLAEAQRVARMGSWEWDIQNYKMRLSDESCRIFGLAPSESGGGG